MEEVGCGGGSDGVHMHTYRCTRVKLRFQGRCML